MTPLVLFLPLALIPRAEGVGLDLVKTLMEAVALTNPLVACSLTPMELKGLAKTFLTWQSIHPRKLDMTALEERGAVICLNDIPDKDAFDAKLKASSRRPWIVLIKAQKSLTIRPSINEQVYFFDLDSQELFESYWINGIEVKHVLAIFTDVQGLTWIDHRLFLARRSNFQGLILKGLTERQPPFANFIRHVDDDDMEPDPDDEELISMAKVEQNGFFYDILDYLKQDLNFSVAIFRRKDRRWGNAVNDSDFDGMVGSLMRNRADIIISCLTLGLERNMVVSYLPAIGKETYSLFIKRDQIQGLDWSALADPFSSSIWFYIFVCPGLTLMTVKLLQVQMYIDDSYDSSCLYLPLEVLWSTPRQCLSSPGPWTSLRVLDVSELLLGQDAQNVGPRQYHSHAHRPLLGLSLWQRHLHELHGLTDLQPVHQRSVSALSDLDRVSSI